MKRHFVKWFPVLFYALLALFAVRFIGTLDWSKLENLTISWPYVLLATILALTFRYWGAYIWTALLRKLGAQNVTFSSDLIYVYAKSWLGRYIPGTAPWILGKIYFASQKGISKNKLAVSSLLEGLLQIVVTLALAIIILLLDTRTQSIIDTPMQLLMLLAIVGCIVVLLPPVFNAVIKIAYRLFKKKSFDMSHGATTSSILIGTWLYLIATLIGGLSFFFIAKAVYPALSYSEMLFVLGVSNLASAVSMLAVFAPSGIGVREAIQVSLLALIMPAEIALVIAIVTRLWGIAVDGLFFGLAATWQSKNSR